MSINATNTQSYYLESLKNQQPQNNFRLANSYVNTPMFNNNVQQPAVDSFNNKTLTTADGKDDGSIGFVKAVGNLFKGVGNFFKGMVCDENGKFSITRTLTTIGIGAAIGAACAFLPTIAVAGMTFSTLGLISAGFGAIAAYHVGDAAIDIMSAKTDAEAEQGWQNLGSGLTEGGLAYLGYRASGGIMAKDTVAPTPSGSIPKTPKTPKTTTEETPVEPTRTPAPKAEAEAKAKAEAEAKVKAEAEAKVKAEAEAKAKAEAEAKAKAEAEAKAKAEAEAKAKAEAEAKAKAEAEAKAKAEAEAKAKAEAEAKAKAEAEAKAKAEAEAKAKAEAELKQFETSIETKSVDELRNIQTECTRRRIELNKLAEEFETRQTGRIFRWGDRASVKYLPEELKLEYELLDKKVDLLAKQMQVAKIKKYERFFGKNENYVNVKNADRYLTAEEAGAFGRYYDIYPYNKALREGADASKIEDCVLMDSGFAKAPALQEEATVYRAVSGHPIFKQQTEWVNSIKEGAIIEDPSYMSTASNPVNAQFEQFASAAFENDGVLMKIKLPKGTKGVYGGYFEYLLPRNSKIKINKIDIIDGVKVADCEYILPSL